MESRLGHDFSRVRVHADERAAQSAQAVNALAYTVGQRVVFAPHQYQPGNTDSLFLLAHELAHTVQQDTMATGDGTAPTRIIPAGAPSEREADAAAQAVLSHRPARLVQGTSGPQLARRGPMPAPAQARPPVVVPSARGPVTVPGARPIYVPSPHDDSFEAALQRSAIKDYSERERLRAERPVATLDRGGKPPDFISVTGSKNHSYMGGPSGTNHTISVRTRVFHVLDAIEYSVARANDEDDLHAILEKFVPMVAIVDDAIALSQGKSRQKFGFGLKPAPVLHFLWDEPLYLPGFDPRAETRLQVFESAVRQRATAVPALQRSRLLSQSRKKGGCRIEPIQPLGDDPMSVLYCHLATGSPFSYRITIEGASGGATRRWAEIDSLRGDTWYECKCGYEALLSGAARGEGVARAVLDKLDKQVLNHADIARTCGLQYRYIVSSETVAETLRQRWFGNVVINVVPFEGCEGTAPTGAPVDDSWW